jgi:lipopolysaccharide export system protein LptA
MFKMKKNSLSTYLLTLLLLLDLTSAFALTSITAGDMEITSNLMTFHNQVYVARGGLKAIQKDSVLTADRGIYDRDLEIVKAIDNVKVVQPGSVLTSDYLEAYVKEDRILARGNPRLVRIVERESNDESGEASVKKTRVILTCNEVEGFNRENRFLAKGNVHVIEVPYREGETEEEALENEASPISDIKCESLELFSEEDKAIARNNVEIITETLRATGDKTIYLNRENRMIIVGHAHAFQTSTEKGSNAEQVSELYANKIIYYPEEDRAIAVGDVHATVYPASGGKSKKDKDKDKKKKKKKKKKEEKSEVAESGSTIEEIPEGLPAGDYTQIPAEGSVIEATIDEEP